MRKVSSAAVALWLACAAISRADSAASPTDAVSSAIAWVEAVRDKDIAKLTERTRFPATVDVNGDAKMCRNRRAKNASTFRLVAERCIIGDYLFRDSIPPRANELASVWKAIDLDALPKRLARHRKRLSVLAGHTFIAGPLSGDGITYDVVFAVSPDGRISAAFAEGEAYE